MPDGKIISRNGNLYAKHDGTLQWIVGEANYNYLNSLITKLSSQITTTVMSAIANITYTTKLQDIFPRTVTAFYCMMLSSPASGDEKYLWEFGTSNYRVNYNFDTSNVGIAVTEYNLMTDRFAEILNMDTRSYYPMKMWILAV